MAFTNNVMIVRHKLLADLVRLWKKDELIDKIDRLPIELSPKKSKPLGRCCVHKERAVWKYKCLPLMGLDMTDEHDELTNLSEYARQALEREECTKENIFCVIDEACSSCVQINYEITNLCRGCVARSCYMNCPKDAIRFKKNGQAMIDHDTCVSCGICHRSCPYHAIVYIPVPCEEACPVKAISKDANGIEHINEDKCIYCGKCMQTCPYGAIMERSKVIDVYKSITAPDKKIIAIPAPAIYGQFNATPGQILSAIKAIGFDDVVEVALGAEDTSRNEAAEFLERMEEGKPFMTTSCCPAYVGWVDKHAPMVKPFVSDTRSPMVYAARRVKEQYPDAEVVFIGPCLAKRYEAEMYVPEVDYVMSFEELGAFMVAYDINPETCEELPLDPEVTKFARGYAQAGGVRNAIVEAVGNGYTTLSLEGLDKKNQTLLKTMVKKPEAQFVEVMACDGGCVNGPCSLAPLTLAKRQIKKALEK